MDVILEKEIFFDILLIQELPQSVICAIPSSSNKEENKIIGTSSYSNWITFSSLTHNKCDYPRGISYIKIHLISIWFSLQNDIFNHKDICCFYFFNNGSLFFMINIYSDNNYLALKYLKDTEANIHNILIMAGDFNIRDSDQDPSFLFHSSHSNSLVEIADSFDLTLSFAIQQVPTQYSDNKYNSNSIINLLFLHSNLVELNNYKIHPELWFSSDHTPLTVNIIIKKEFIQQKRHTIIKNNEDKSNFIDNFIKTFQNIDIRNIITIEFFKSIV